MLSHNRKGIWSVTSLKLSLPISVTTSHVTCNSTDKSLVEL